MKMKNFSSVFFIMVLLSVSQEIDASTIDLNKMGSNLAQVVAEISSWDEDKDSAVWQLKGYLDAGNTLIDKDALIEALVYAESMVEKKSAQLSPDQLTHVNDALSMLADIVNNEDDAGRSEKIVIKKKVKFLKDVTFKDKASFDHFVGFHGNTHFHKNVEIDCNLTVGCNLSLSDSISQDIGNVVKNGNPFISTYPGSASQNTFVGENSGNFTMTGTQNSAFGNGALANNMTGNFNTAVGYQAMNDNITGSENACLGSETFTTGNECVAVGHRAGFSTGDKNISVGHSAGNLGDENVAVGHFAFNGNGNFNVAVGNGAFV